MTITILKMVSPPMGREGAYVARLTAKNLRISQEVILMSETKWKLKVGHLIACLILAGLVLPQSCWPRRADGQKENESSTKRRRRDERDPRHAGRGSARSAR